MVGLRLIEPHVSEGLEPVAIVGMGRFTSGKNRPWSNTVQVAAGQETQSRLLSSGTSCKQEEKRIANFQLTE